jgi:poly-beta-1,6-N-acetyl-D-glucosamine synthase
MFAGHVIFWGAVALLAYTYAGYPLLLRAWAALGERPPRCALHEPAVSVLIVACNEAERVGARLENCLALDYPRERFEIVLASDGSTDATVERARAFERAGVTVVAFPARRGKTAVLNELIPALGNEIVVLADARQRFEAGALRHLVAAFADPAVGAVSGELMLVNGAGSAVGEGLGFYWKYEKSIRRNESRIDSTVGATGAIYAIRRALFEPIPADTLVDDVLIPLRIVRRGYRVLFEPRARAYDQASTTAGIEFERKVRTLAGNFQLFAREPWLLNPVSNRLWLQTLSHKGCRLLGPMCLAAAAAANLFLLAEPLYRSTFAAQALFYAAAAGGCLLRQRARRHWLLHVPYTFCLLNAAVVAGLWRLVSGRQRVTWKRRGDDAATVGTKTG